jgi:hypothetical protein
LGLGAKNGILRFRNVSIDDCRKRWIFFPLEAAGALELGFGFDDPGVGCLFALKGLGFVVNDLASFLMTIWAM